MLDYLKDKKDVGFFLSLQALMQTCRYMPFTVFYFKVNFKMLSIIYLIIMLNYINICNKKGILQCWL